MRHHFEQAALSHRQNLWHSTDRLRVERSIPHDAQTPDLFRDQHVAVGEKREAPRRREPFYEWADADGRSGGQCVENSRLLGSRERSDAREGWTTTASRWRAALASARRCRLLRRTGER